MSPALDTVIGMLEALPQWVLAVSETLEALPAVVLCVAACADRARADKRDLLRWAVPVAAVLLVVEGLLCAAHDLPTWPMAAADIPILIAFLVWATDLTLAQVAFVAMTNVFVAIDIVYFAAIADAYMVGDVLSHTFLAWPGLLTQWVLWALALLFLWRAARDMLPRAFASPVVSSRAWHTLWLMPTLLTATVQLLRPGDVTIYWIGRVTWNSIAFMSLVSALAVMVYLQMWQVLQLTEQEFQTESELHSAELAQEQVAHLNKRIEAARRQRHDLRHHIHALQGFLQDANVSAAQAYLDELSENLRAENAPIRYCENAVINTALVYYCDTARAIGARVDVAVQVSAAPAQRESDITAVVFNLLENATDALQDQAMVGSGPLDLRIRMEERADGLYMTVDNTCLSELIDQRNGIFASTKPDGHGLGLQSVRQTAERTGGLARFELDGSIFCASVMLGNGR